MNGLKGRGSCDGFKEVTMRTGGKGEGADLLRRPSC